MVKNRQRGFERMEKLTIEISNIRGIGKMEINLPIIPDVYAITGLNGVGKSSLLACLTCRLIRPINFVGLHSQDYTEESCIKYRIGDKSETWRPTKEGWKVFPQQTLNLRGFQEGSMTQGTRFSHIFGFGYYRSLLKVRSNLLNPADEFVVKNLGAILHNKPDYYEGLFRLDRTKAKKYYNYDGVLYYRKIEEKLISQFDFSTGELMLINLLHLVNNLLVRNNNREKLNFILIDEVELALHPSAIRRLIPFMKQIATQYNVAIYFATHSLEIIYGLPVENLIYLQRSGTNHIDCITPCYPAYISRDIYVHYGYDIVIFVEDDLAKNILDRYISKNNLETNKRIQVLPVGGYDNTLNLHQSFIEDRVLNDQTQIISILDGDVEATVLEKQKDDNTWSFVPPDNIMFLPIQSLERFLKHKLFDEKDYTFIRKVRDNFFRFETAIDWYEAEYLSNIKNKQRDDQAKGKPAMDNSQYFKNGKNLFSILEEKAFSSYGLNRSQFRKMICSFIVENFNFDDFEKALAKKLCWEKP